jgi:hypothetical protein
MTDKRGIPLPGQHLPQSVEPADPEAVRAEVAELLAGLSGAGGSVPPIGARARILEQAHDVLVRALGTVDKI